MLEVIRPSVLLLDEVQQFRQPKKGLLTEMLPITYVPAIHPTGGVISVGDVALELLRRDRVHIGGRSPVDVRMVLSLEVPDKFFLVLHITLEDAVPDTSYDGVNFPWSSCIGASWLPLRTRTAPLDIGEWLNLSTLELPPRSLEALRLLAARGIVLGILFRDGVDEVPLPFLEIRTVLGHRDGSHDRRLKVHGSVVPQVIV